MDVLGLFLEGILSFLSPCVLPLLPLYMSYLSGGLNNDKQNKTARIFLMTLFFVFGISTVFILLAVSIDIIRPFIEEYDSYISLVGGLLIIAFGLHETGLINITILDNEKRISLPLAKDNMTYLKSYLLGFTFSFAWTPCIGPMLASAIIMASTSDYGSLYILVYALGLIIPFLITGLFTSFVLDLIKKKKHLFKYVMIVAGIIMIGYGIYMVYNSISTLVSPSSKSEDITENVVYVDDYEFMNQDGEIIKLTDYSGKYIFLNFTTTWCTYCQSEIPDYLEFSKDNNDCVCLYVMSTTTSGCSNEEILEYIKENNIDINVIFDEEGVLPDVSGYPTIYVIDKDGKYLGYVSGAMDKDGFENILEIAKEEQ